MAVTLDFDFGGDPLQDVASQFREFIHLDRKHRTDGLTAAELDRWSRLKRALGRKFSPDLSNEHSDARRSVRVPTQLRVDFASVDELRGQRMTNLSRGGLFVATAHQLAIGTRVTLLVHIDESGDTLEIPAEVASHNVGPQYASDQQGMGLRFLEMDAATSSRLEALYEASLETATRESPH
jgi:uncharacterized protein (TIGR02266 family)